MKTGQWTWLPIICAPVPAIAVPAYAATYLTVEQAQQSIFPGQKLSQSFVTLTSEQAREIERRSDAKVRHKEVQLWKASGGGYFIVDEVVGKHEFITYAVGLNADGTVKQIEIMTYRESYGYEVRNADWRAQFVGKNASAPLKLSQDIKNISGATLSCRHITDGVKRILATYEIALK
jgi:Na+-translocating ferredoxin:NAD+ oxidoreductase RnfG subunit